MDLSPPLNPVPEEAPWSIIPPQQIGLVTPLSGEQVRLWALVLTARAIPCMILPNAGSWLLAVPPELHETACRELQIFEEQNHNWPPPLPPTRPQADNSLITISILILIAIFHNVIRINPELFSFPWPDWAAIGSAQTDVIRSGEWWRVVTALTLHNDAAHLFGNLAIGSFFLIPLARELGSGLAWSLTIAAGSLGNLINAYVQPATHNSLGGSTAVFAAIGILGALSFIRHRHHSRKRWMLPIAGAVTFLTILGTEGKNTDLGAHLTGFISGIGTGIITEFLLEQWNKPSRPITITLGLGTMVTIIGAWALAIGTAG